MVMVVVVVVSCVPQNTRKNRAHAYGVLYWMNRGRMAGRQGGMIRSIVGVP